MILRIKVFIVTSLGPLLIMWALLHQDGKLLAWAVVELPKLFSESQGER